MEESQAIPSGESNENASGALEQSQRDAVKYETYKKAVGEKKRYQQRVEEMQKRLEEIEQKNMELEGNKDSLIEDLKGKLTQTQSVLEQQREAFAWRSIGEQVKSIALQKKCRNPDDLFIHVKDKIKKEDVDLDDSFKVSNTDLLERLIDEQKKERFYLFEEDKPPVDDQVPHSTNSNPSGSYEEELKNVKSQRELDDLRKKYGRA